MNNNLFNILLNTLKKIEDETNLSQDDVTKGFKQLFPLIESIGNDEGDILDSIIYEGLKSNDIKDVIFYYLDCLEKILLKSINMKDIFMINDLKFILTDKDEFENELSSRTEIDTRNIRLFLITKTLLKAKINELYSYSNVTPKDERIAKGKTPKAKKPDQIKAEEWVKDVWRMHPDVTQGQMAIDVKDALDLPQTIKTITGWIKPLDPQKGKRKRKPKDYYQ